MKVQLLSTNNGMKSGGLKRVALALSAALKYKVFRTTTQRANRKQFRYGDAVNKLEQYKWFQQQGLSALEFTTDSSKACEWLNQDKTVFGRKLLNASCGDGIVVMQGPAQDVFAACPVYTLYKPKKREFRVHVFKDKVVTIVEKRRKKDWNGDKKDTKVRNLANGYIFCQEVELVPALKERIEQLALASSKVCSSDFRGVDIGYNEKQDDVFVIEVNSAPGIEGSNVEKYIGVIKSYV